MNVRFYLDFTSAALSHLPDESFMTSPQIEVLNDVGHKRLIKQIKCNTNAGAEWIVSKIKHYPCDIINYINRLTSKYLDQGTLIEKFIKYSLFYMLIKNQVLILSMWKRTILPVGVYHDWGWQYPWWQGSCPPVLWYREARCCSSIHLAYRFVNRWLN